MRKVAPKDTVFLEGSRKLRVERVYLRICPGWFWQGKLRKIAKNACKKALKSLDIKSWPSEVAMGWDGMEKISTFIWYPDPPTHDLEIFLQFLQALNALFLSKKKPRKTQNSPAQRAIFASFQPTPCPYEQLCSYFRPDRLKNLIFSIKLGGCG